MEPGDIVKRQDGLYCLVINIIKGVKIRGREAGQALGYLLTEKQYLELKNAIKIQRAQGNYLTFTWDYEAPAPFAFGNCIKKYSVTVDVSAIKDVEPKNVIDLGAPRVE